jgi:hypothetical protein
VVGTAVGTAVVAELMGGFAVRIADDAVIAILSG